MLKKMRLKLAKWIAPKRKPGSPFSPEIKEELKKNTVQESAHCRQYSSFSGFDIKITFDGDPKATIQKFTWNSSGNGTVKFIVFGSGDHEELLDLFGSEVHVEMKACNEYGDITVLFDGVVQFALCEEFITGIDDLVVEVALPFNIISRNISTKKGKRLYCPKENVKIMDLEQTE